MFINVNQIYQQYQIPPNVIEHMDWVTDVVREVLKNWNGPAVDGKLAVLSARLHDLGNIVKFRRPFEGKLAIKLIDDLDHWYAVQDRFIAKYGTDANQATHQIVAELGLTDSVGRVLGEMEYIADRCLVPADSQAPAPPISWEARILEYADCRVTPDGIVPFEIRLKDLCDRYGRDYHSPWTEALRQNATLVEKNCA